MKLIQIFLLSVLVTRLVTQKTAAVSDDVTPIDVRDPNFNEAEFEHDEEPGIPPENTAEKQEDCPFNERLQVSKDIHEQYIKFAREFGKAYLCDEKEGNFYPRLQIFANTLALNERFTREFPNASFTVGLTVFADLTDQERERRTGVPERDLDNPNDEPVQLLPDGDFSRDEGNIDLELNQQEFTLNLQNAEIFQKFIINWDFICCLFNPFGVPCSKDWQALGKVTSVKNQLSCGSCWAFAAAASVESAYAIKYGWNLNLSEQELVSCATSAWGNYGCSGGWPHKALDYIIKNRIYREVNFPYTATNAPCISPVAYKYPIKSRTIVLPQNRMDTFLQALNKRPIAVAFKACGTFFSYTSGIYDPSVDACSTSGINHAVLAVGFKIGCKPYIRFKNSWGTGWGEAGFFRMKIAKTISQNGPCNLINHPYNVYPSI